ncbi:MAG TPA: hypothetical protein VI756_31170, partial [Blastocatellia bacterium]
KTDKLLTSILITDTVEMLCIQSPSVSLFAVSGSSFSAMSAPSRIWLARSKNGNHQLSTAQGTS